MPKFKMEWTETSHRRGVVEAPSREVLDQWIDSLGLELTDQLADGEEYDGSYIQNTIRVIRALP